MVWSFLITFWQILPWVAVGLMAILALRKRKGSRTLALQAGGATALVVLAMAKWVVVSLILEGLAFPKGAYAGRIIFDFLLFLALCAFAAGYCAERFARRKPEEITPQKPPAS